MRDNALKIEKLIMFEYTSQELGFAETS